MGSIEDLELGAVLGKGVFGTVHKAKRKSDGMIVAVKIVDLEPEDDVKLLQAEVERLTKLDDPRIVRYYGSAVTSDLAQLWIVMEYASGITIPALLKEGKGQPLNEDYLAYVLREICLGLLYLHDNGKIHRNIRGANVLIDKDGNVKLADFGVAGHLSEIFSKRHTFIGTPLWMAPEVIKEGWGKHSDYDSKADIWSVGITAMEMAQGGKVPHDDVHPMQALFKIPKSDPPRLHDKKHSDALKDFVATCLEVNPKARPPAKTLLTHAFIATAKTMKPSSASATTRRRSRSKGSKGSKGSKDASKPTA